MYSMMGWRDGKIFVFYCLVFLSPASHFSSAGQSNNCSILTLCDDAHDMHLNFKLQVLEVNDVAKPFRI